MSTLSGNLTGLKSIQLKNINRISKKRLNPRSIISIEMAKVLAEISTEIGRQIGVLVNRQGYIEYTIIGDWQKIVLPDLKRTRIGKKRFCGLRLLHTHLKQEKLSQDDLLDLALLRLDLVAAIIYSADLGQSKIQMAHLLPQNNDNRLWRIFNPLPISKLNDNFLELISALEAEFSKESNTRTAKQNKNRALLIGVYSKNNKNFKNRIEELESLSESAGINTVDKIQQIRSKLDPKYLVGKGKLQDIVLGSLQNDIEMLVFDHDLTPAQAKSLSNFTDLKIIDRTQLILDIFAQHASTRDGKLQVELAQLKYLKNRLSEKDDNMSRLTGGIGGRGPGETKLEIGNRRVQERIKRLESQLKKLRLRRDLRRKKRKNQSIPVVSLIGYTNTGKSTLLNTLTKSTVVAENKLFATLDPTSRRVRFPRDREIILSDTVGFIQDLPPTLLNAFKATIEELYDSNLFLHVINISSEQMKEQISTIADLLKKLELDHIPVISVFNQCDRFSPLLLNQKINKLESQHLFEEGKAIFISAKKKENIPALISLMEKNLWRGDGSKSNKENILLSIN